MDCSILPTGITNQSMIQTIDFFYPLVLDPYKQGKIACANVLSDLYAMGIVRCDNMLMTLGVSRDMTEEEQKIVTVEMIRGFNDLAKEAGTKVTGGQTVKNPWPIIGGVATSVLMEHEFIRPENAVDGDVLILTKPIGTQSASNAKQWLDHGVDSPQFAKIKNVVTPEQVNELYYQATDSMARLNLEGAKLMHKHAGHACTDVTGFGLLGHADNLAKAQNEKVVMEINALPCLPHSLDIAKNTWISLEDGKSAETSGGLLIALPAANAQPFIDDIMAIEGKPAWIIGKVRACVGDEKPHAVVVDSVNRFSI
eukprot:TRINITY_DN1341_c0_g1_i1.p1 TRINITY_DN1341_c0_g1~~TRINITY_DN1341_c0_g1_i1.p1  ORF type:complete len:311 (-),score=91.00 TRINITY_DN1341_c0_g1_i1:272-1204(-)